MTTITWKRAEIRRRDDGREIFALDTPSANPMRAAVEAAVRRRVSLLYADLRGADLSGAYLVGAMLRGADVAGATFTGAHLRSTLWGDANLHEANLGPIRADARAAFDAAPDAVAEMLEDLREGRFDGLKAAAWDDDARPVARWCTAIRSGRGRHNPVAELFEQWIVEWLDGRGGAS